MTNATDSQVIVSCTTTSERLELLYYMIESLKRQARQPDRILVNLSRAPYLNDRGIGKLPSWLEQAPVEINWVENTGPYRKLLPALRSANTQDIIITADDDVLYGPNWVERLVNAALTHPDHIVCARARRMKRSAFNRWQNYARWPLARKPLRFSELMPTGSGGVAYRKLLLDLDFLWDPSFIDLAPTTDDLWFRMASFRIGTPVLVIPEIEDDNIHLNHQHGLENTNRITPTDLFWTNAYRYTLGQLRDWLGINNSENDRAWDRIWSYAQKDRAKDA